MSNIKVTQNGNKQFNLKTMNNFKVTQNGKTLSKDKYTWDKNTKTFSTIENNLVLDFSGIDNCIFKTGADCAFKTGSECTFDTGSSCAFKTGASCAFKTGYDCIFKTDSDCKFKTGSDCVVVRRDIYEIIELKE